MRAISTPALIVEGRNFARNNNGAAKQKWTWGPVMCVEWMK